MSQPDGAVPRRRRHLLDQSLPLLDSREGAGAVARAAESERKLLRVQRWVASTLAVTTLLHLAFGVVLLAVSLPDSATGSRAVLHVIAAAFGVVGVGAGLAIHGRRVVSPWLLLGVLPGLVGAWLTR